MELSAIISLISLAVQAAPQVETEVSKVYQDGKTVINALASKGVISTADQDAAMKWADDHQAAVLAGNEPPEFKVE